MGCDSIYYAKKSCESSIVTEIGAQNRYDLNFAPAGLKMKNELSKHLPHTFIWETIQKDFFTIEYEGVIIISIGVLRRELARELLPVTFQS